MWRQIDKRKWPPLKSIPFIPVLPIHPKEETGQDPTHVIVTSPETPTKLEDSSIPDISTEPAVHLVLPEAVTVPEVVKRPDVQDAECLAGSEWQSYCYSCRCSASGLAECRRIDECKEFQGWCCVCKMPYLPICNQETAVKFGRYGIQSPKHTNSA